MKSRVFVIGDWWSTGVVVVSLRAETRGDVLPRCCDKRGAERG